MSFYFLIVIFRDFDLMKEQEGFVKFYEGELSSAHHVIFDCAYLLLV